VASIRLLIVEDHALVREGLVRLLAAHPGLDVVGEAEGATDAIDLVRTRKPDVVLLDIALAETSGLDLIKPILAENTGTRVLMVTMHDEPGFATAAIERGAMGLVSKDATVEDLAQAIGAARRGEILHPEGALSEREREVLGRISEGDTDAEIAERLSISRKTVEGHTQRIMAKLAIHTRAGLVAYACRAFIEQDLA